MQINDVTRFPNLLPDITNSAWADSGKVDSNNYNYAGGNYSYNETVNFFLLNKDNPTLGNLTQALSLDTSKFYTLSMSIRSDKGITDDVSMVKVLYDNDTQQGLELVTFGNFYGCRMSYVYNFMGKGTIKNLRFQYVGDNNNNVFVSDVRLQQGQLDSQYVITPQDKQTYKAKLDNINSHWSNNYSNNALVNTMYTDTTNVYKHLTSLPSAYTTNMYPYRYAIECSDWSTLPKADPVPGGYNLTLNFSNGAITDGIKFNYLMGNVSLLVGNKDSKDHSYDEYQQNNTNYNNYCDISQYAYQMYMNASISKTYNYFNKLNSITWTGGGGFEYMNYYSTFPEGTPFTFKFTLVPDMKMTFQYGGNTYEIYPGNGYVCNNNGRIAPLNANSPVLDWTFDTLPCGEQLDLDDMYSKLMMILNNYTNLDTVNNLKSTKDQLSGVYNNIQAALPTYSPYGLNLSNLTDTVNTYLNNYDSSITMLLKGYIGDDGWFYNNDTDWSTDYIPVEPGKWYTWYTPQPASGWTRFIAYDINKVNPQRLFSQNQSGTLLQVKIPDNCYYLRCCKLMSGSFYDQVELIIDEDNNLTYSSIPNGAVLGNADSSLKAINSIYDTVNNRLSMMYSVLQTYTKGMLLNYTFTISTSNGNMKVLKFDGTNANDNLNALGAILNDLTNNVDMQINNTATEFIKENVASTYLQNGKPVDLT